MANHDSKLSTAFNFREIISKIANNGWMAFIIWYILTGFVFGLILGIGNTLISIFNIGGSILVSLIGFAYIYIYLFRSVALFYMSK